MDASARKEVKGGRAPRVACYLCALSGPARTELSPARSSPPRDFHTAFCLRWESLRMAGLVFARE
eukprot:1250264-Rhodomonas_salina.3